MMNPFLIGDKCYLRPLERADAAVIAPWFNDQEVVRTMLSYRPMSVGAEEAWLADNAKGHGIVVGIALRATDELVGSTGLNQIDLRNRHACFGIVIGRKDLWGQGLGTEATRLVVDYAFATLNLHRIWLHAYEYNERGVRAYEKVGFKREGVLREDCYRDGRYWDTIAMAIIRADWEAQRRP
jgi:RimJ/RimL family protein N-acetyltransferase